MTTATRTAPHHNNTTCYTAYGCRLPECVARIRAYERDRRRARAAGISPFVDAEPVRQHLLALLAAGISPTRVAALTGYPDRTIRGFIERQIGPRGRRMGLRQRTSPVMAQAILAIPVDPAMAAKVNSVASCRRIQALIAIGWPQLHIARNCAISYETLSEAMRQPTIMAASAQAITDTYNNLRDKRPIRNGVSARQTNMARARAASHQWPTPDYWDDPDHPIDDEGFEPEYGVSRAEIIAKEARWLLDSGFHRDHVAQRLGISRFYLDRSLREYPETKQAAA